LSATTRKSLRPYQVRLITDVCRACGPVLVEQPTGSGKTIQIVTLVAMQLGRGFTHAVIAAPQQQIEQPFVYPDSRLISSPSVKESDRTPSRRRTYHRWNGRRYWCNCLILQLELLTEGEPIHEFTVLRKGLSHNGNSENGNQVCIMLVRQG
jgi:hypothetical protein